MTKKQSPHLDWEQYFMRMAAVVRQKGNCVKGKVGAVIVLDNRLLATGYNGTPSKMTNCQDGGCKRCETSQEDSSAQIVLNKEFCLYVHAEQNAIASAARFGISIAGSTIYSTREPCFTCTKELLQAKVSTVYFLEKYKCNLDPALLADLERMRLSFSGYVRCLVFDHPHHGEIACPFVEIDYPLDELRPAA